MAVLTPSRGSTLVVSLLLGVLILLLGMALLSVQSSHRRAARALEAGVQAKLLAEAGLEDARVKLSRDPFYPDATGSAQPTFSYTETLPSGPSKGSFSVTIDRSRIDEPYFLLIIESTGRVGRPGPESSRTLQVAIDVCPFSRSNPSIPNPDLFRVLSLRDSAAP